MNRISCFILFVPILLSTVALQTVTAQKKPSGSKASAADKLVALKVTGTTRYTDREILAASGLQMGQNAATGVYFVRAGSGSSRTTLKVGIIR